MDRFFTASLFLFLETGTILNKNLIKLGKITTRIFAEEDPLVWAPAPAVQNQVNTMSKLECEQLFFIIGTGRYILEPRHELPAVSGSVLVEASQTILSRVRKPLSTLKRIELEALINELGNELKKKDIRLATRINENKKDIVKYLISTFKKGNEEVLDEISKNKALEQEIRDVLTRLEETLRHERALESAGEIGDKKQKILDLSSQGKAYFSSHNYKKAAKYLEEALELAEEIKDTNQKALDLNLLGKSYFFLRKHRKAIKYLEEALELDKEIKDKRQRAVDLNLLGNAYLSSHNPEKAIKYLEKALTLAEEIKDKRSQAVDLNLLGSAYLACSNTEKAVENLEKALELDIEIKDKRSQAIDLNLLGKTYLSIKKHKRSVKYLEKALELDREIDDKKSQAIDLNLLAKAYMSFNHFNEAREHLEEALKIDEEIGDKRQQGFDLNSLGRVYEKLGQSQEAITCYERSLQISRELNDTRSMSFNLYALGQIYYELKDYSKAEEYFGECSKLPSGTNPAILMNIFEKLGILYESRRDRKAALKFYKKAYEFSKGKRRSKLERRIQNVE